MTAKPFCCIADEQRHVTIKTGGKNMQYTVLHYYKEFTCTAGKCPDTCCAGWKIMIDKNSLRKYKKTKTIKKKKIQNHYSSILCWSFVSGKEKKKIL